MTTENEAAIYILATIARARLQPAPDAPSVPELRTLLTAAFDEPVPSGVTEGELAQAALDVLAENPEFADPSHGKSNCHKFIASALPGAGHHRRDTAALLALQTRIGFKIDHTGKWSLNVDKKAASDSTLKLLVQRLLSLLPK